MARFRQNDRLPPLTAIAVDKDDKAIDLTVFASITFKMVSGATVVTGSATGDANGNLTYAWGPTDLAVPGIYAATFKGLDSGGKPETLPTGVNLVIEVVPAL